MDAQATSLTAETATLREVYAALNRGDIPGAVKHFAQDIRWIEPSEYPLGGTYTGRDAVEAHLSRARATWAEGTCDPEELAPYGNRIVAVINVHVRLKTETVWREGRHADVYTFRDGKVIEMRIFDDIAEGHRWAKETGQKSTETAGKVRPAKLAAKSPPSVH